MDGVPQRFPSGPNIECLFHSCYILSEKLKDFRHLRSLTNEKHPKRSPLLLPMTTPLQQWLNNRRSSPDLGSDLAHLLGCVWKSHWNRYWNPANPARHATQALQNIQEWAQTHASFPDTWTFWVQCALEAPERLVSEADALIAFCELPQERIQAWAPQPTTPPAVIPLDFRHIPCPENSMRCRLALSRMVPRQKVCLWIDSGSPIENVPSALIADGHRILQRTHRGTFWELLVERSAGM